MNIDEKTKEIAENYFALTGIGEARRLSLTPEEYMVFRRQAISEIGNSIIATESHSEAPVTLRKVSQKESASIKPVASDTENTKPIVVKKEEKPKQTRQRDDMSDLLASIPG